MPVVAPPATVAAPALLNEALEARVRQLEGMVNQLSGRVQQGSAAQGSRPAGCWARAPPDTAPASPGTGAGGPGPGVRPNVLPSQTGGFGASGQSLPPNPSLNKRFNSPATLTNSPGSFKFGPGFELRSNDDEFFLQFHNLTQVEYRGYQQGGQSQVHDSFAIPRQWFMFSGRISQPVGYFVSLSQGFDSVNALDVFMEFTASPKLNLRMGRMKTPFTYEFLVEPIQGLINPERSVFFNNFGQNRDVGGMAYGRLLNNTFDYAAGIWNGRVTATSPTRTRRLSPASSTGNRSATRKARSSRTSTSVARSTRSTRTKPIPLRSCVQSSPSLATTSSASPS